MADLPLDLRISDHALVRFIERIKGVSLDAYRDELRGIVTANWPNTTPPPDHDPGMAIAIENLGLPVIVTVMGAGMRPKRPKGFGQRIVYVPSGEPQAQVADEYGVPRG